MLAKWLDPVATRETMTAGRHAAGLRNLVAACRRAPGVALSGSVLRAAEAFGTFSAAVELAKTPSVVHPMVWEHARREGERGVEVLRRLATV